MLMFVTLFHASLKGKLPAMVITCTVQAEADRVIFEDDDPEIGFLLHPDLKWVSTSPAMLACVLVMRFVPRNAVPKSMCCAIRRTSAKQKLCTALPW